MPREYSTKILGKKQQAQTRAGAAARGQNGIEYDVYQLESFTLA